MAEISNELDPPHGVTDENILGNVYLTRQEMSMYEETAGQLVLAYGPAPIEYTAKCLVLHDIPPRQELFDAHDDRVRVPVSFKVIYGHQDRSMLCLRGGGGNPYAGLEDSDDDDGIAAFATRGASSAIIDRARDIQVRTGQVEIDEDQRLFISGGHDRNNTRFGVTTSVAGWGNSPSTSGSGSASGLRSNAGSAYSDRTVIRNNENSSQRQNPGAGSSRVSNSSGRSSSNRSRSDYSAAPSVAPAFGFVPKMDNYQLEGDRDAFRFLAAGVNLTPGPAAGWRTVDPELNLRTGQTAADQRRAQNTADRELKRIAANPLTAALGITNIKQPDSTAATGSQNASLSRSALSKLVNTTPTTANSKVAEYLQITSNARGSNASNADTVSITSSAALFRQGSMSVANSSERYGHQSEAASEVTDEMDYQMDDQIDIIPEVEDQFIPANDTAALLRAAGDTKSRIYKQNSTLRVAQGPANKIVNDFGGGIVTEVELKVEDRLEYMNAEGKYVDDINRGEVKKRYRIGHREVFDALEKEIIRASKEYHIWKEMSEDERFRSLKAYKQPARLFNGRPVPFDEDMEEVEEADIPALYKERPSDRKKDLHDKRNRTKARRSTSQSSGRSRASCASSAKYPISRSRLEVETLLKRLTINPSVVGQPSDGERTPTSSGRSSKRHPSVAQSQPSATPRARSNGSNRGGSRSGSNIYSPPRRPPSSVSGISIQSRQAQRNAPLGGELFEGNLTSEEAFSAAANLEDLVVFDDSPELQIPEDVEDGIAFQNRDLVNIAEDTAARCLENGRVLTVRLHEHIKFSGGRMATRIFGGPIQEFQFHMDKRTAVVVFLDPIDASEFLTHVKTVHESGERREILDMGIEADWYKGEEEMAILAPQHNLMSHSIAGEATRQLRLHHLPLNVKYDTMLKDLSMNLGVMILKMSLARPPPHRENEGREAFVEFATLKDSIEGFERLSMDDVLGFTGCDPVFVNEASMAELPFAKAYCQCQSCVDARDKRLENHRIRWYRDASRIEKATSRATSSRAASSQVATSQVASSRAGSSIMGRSASQRSQSVSFDDESSSTVSVYWSGPGSS